MKVGDLVKVKDCTPQLDTMAGAYLDFACECFFCTTGSNRIGFVTGPAPRNSWHVMFDTGMWRLADFEEARGEVEVIGESR